MTVCSSVGIMSSKNGGRGFEPHHTVAYKKPRYSGFFISFLYYLMIIILIKF